MKRIANGHCRSAVCSLLFAALAAGCLAFAASSADAKEPVQAFLDGLRRRGYFDTADEYLQSLRTDPAIDAETKQLIPYEQGRTLVESSKSMRDLALRMKTLDEASGRFDEFIENSPKHPQAGMARIQLGNLLIERGRAFLEMSKRKSNEPRKDELVNQAKGEFGKAVTAFEAAVKDFDAKWKSYPKFIDQSQTKLRAERAQAVTTLIQAQLYAATAVYEFSKCFDPKSKEYVDKLKQAAGKYNELYAKWRTRLAGLYAGMWEARCYQDIDDQESIRRALGVYDELLAQPDQPEAMRALKIKVLRLALEAWLHTTQKKFEECEKRADAFVKQARPDEEASPEGLAIRYFGAQAKHLMIVRENAKKEKQDANAIRRWKKDVVAYTRVVADKRGEFEKPAKELLAKYRQDASEGGDPTTFAEARDQAKAALDASQEHQFNLANEKDPAKRETLQKDIDIAMDDAIRLFRLSLRLKEEAEEGEVHIDEVNVVRYFLAYLYYRQGWYYDAAVQGEFLAKNYPQSSGARHGAKIALASYVQLYNAAVPDANKKKPFETAMMVGIAEFTAKTWPEEAEGDEAWMMLADIAIREKDLDAANEYLEKISDKSPRRADADLKAGQAYWSRYLTAQRQDPKPAAAVTDKLMADAQAKLTTGIDAKRKALGESNPIDYSLLAGELSLAQILLNQGNSEEAVAAITKKRGLLDLLKTGDEAVQQGNLAQESYKVGLRAFVATQDIDRAGEMMKELEDLTKGKPNAQGLLTQIYISLGYQVKGQVEALRGQAATNPSLKPKLDGLLAGFDKFLQRIASGAGDVNLSQLDWIAETYVGLADGLGQGPKASEYYKQAAATYEKMLARDDAKDITSAIKIRLAKSKRGMGAYKDAVNLLIVLLRENSVVLEAQKEACLTFTEWARNEDPKYFRYAMFGYYDREKRAYVVWGWGKTAKRVQPKMRTDDKMRSIFHEARYNLANCRYEWAMKSSGAEKQDLMNKAFNDIAIVYKLYPKMGGEQWRPQYDTLLKKIQRELNKNVDGLDGLASG